MDIDINQDCQFMSVLQSLETSGYISMLGNLPYIQTHI